MFKLRGYLLQMLNCVDFLWTRKNCSLLHQFYLVQNIGCPNFTEYMTDLLTLCYIISHTIFNKHGLIGVRSKTHDWKVWKLRTRDLKKIKYHKQNISILNVTYLRITGFI